MHNESNAEAFARAVEAYLEADAFDLAADPADPGPDDALAGLRASLSDPEASAAAVDEWRNKR